jgi:hypothetical protein
MGDAGAKRRREGNAVACVLKRSVGDAVITPARFSYNPIKTNRRYDTSFSGFIANISLAMPRRSMATL